MKHCTLWLGLWLVPFFALSADTGHEVGPPPARPSIIIFAHQQGCATVLFDKWHFGDAPDFMPLRDCKCMSWKGGIRESCIVSWPEKFPARTDGSDILMTIDLLPTGAWVAGAELPANKMNELQTVISMAARCKMHLPHSCRPLAGKPPDRDGVRGLYFSGRFVKPEVCDLCNDVSETTDVSETFPEIPNFSCQSPQDARRTGRFKAENSRLRPP